MPEIVLILFVLAMGTWIAAGLGAALIIFVKKGSRSVTDLILGIAAGVILMVVFVELLHPAIHMADTYSALPAWLVVPGAFATGFLATFALDVHISGLKAKREAEGRPDIKYKKGMMLFGALSIHSIPEGLAIGILLGALGGHFRIEELLVFIPIVAAVGLHKFPEGAAISVAFQNEGASKLKSFLMGQASGFVGFLSGVIGFVVALNVDDVLPYAMAFAAGAMIWVAIHELIPESRKSKATRPYLAVVGVFLGILMMLVVDITLHDHDHAHDHGHSHEYHEDHDHHDEHHDDHDRNHDDHDDDH